MPCNTPAIPHSMCLQREHFTTISWMPASFVAVEERFHHLPIKTATCCGVQSGFGCAACPGVEGVRTPLADVYATRLAEIREANSHYYVL